jgi:hypothetical protein
MQACMDLAAIIISGTKISFFWNLAYQYATGISVNAIEGFTAFLGKREPKWDESSIF